MPKAAAAAARVARLEGLAICAARHQPDIAIAVPAREAEREQDVSPFSGCGALHLLHSQQRLLVRAMLTLLVGEWLGGAQRVPAVVELEEVVVEMVRAYSWEASLKESNVGVHFPLSSTDPEGLDRILKPVVARMCN